MKIIGVTGSSGSGKTTLTKILEKELNAYVIDADKVVKKLQKIGEPYYNEIVKTFGKEIVLQDGEIDRKKLSNIIFEDTEKREALNKLTYKYVINEIKNEITKSTKKYIIIDAPLLIESGLNNLCSKIIAVISSKKEQIKRIIKRDNIEENAAISRLNAQPTNEFYIKNADYIVENNGGEDGEFMGRIRKIMQELL